MDNTCVITGATGAIGSHIARSLIVREVRDAGPGGPSLKIILACRNEAKASQLISELNESWIGDKKKRITVEYIHLDLESFKSVNAFVKEIADRHTGISILFNNAGTMPGEMRLTVDGYESSTQVNYLATRLLTQKLLPYVEEGGAIVFTTSLTRHFTRLCQNWEERSRLNHNRFITYGRSKRMITAYAMRLSRQLAERRIRVNCSDPWIVDSQMIRLGIPWIDRLSDRYFRPLIHHPEQGAETALRAAFSPLTGKIFS